MRFIVYDNDNDVEVGKVTKKGRKKKKDDVPISAENGRVIPENRIRRNLVLHEGESQENKFIIYDPIPEDWNYIDAWVPKEEDIIFKSIDKAIILPVSAYYGAVESDLDFFIISSKRCYNKPAMRDHLTGYLNYFEKFYDPEHELLAIMYQLKYIMDYHKEYTESNFISDLCKYILHNRSILFKLYRMNEDNYSVFLQAKEGKSVESLQYTTKHGKILMQMSVLANMVIPLVCHFIHINKIDNVDGMLLKVYDYIIDLSSVDIYSKLYETTASEVNRNKKINNKLWEMQDIRGRSSDTHILASIENILLNIMPKYTYDRNIISFNYVSIKYNIGYKITDIKYEYSFSMLSSSQRDKVCPLL